LARSSSTSGAAPTYEPTLQFHCEIQNGSKSNKEGTNFGGSKETEDGGTVGGVVSFIFALVGHISVPMNEIPSRKHKLNEFYEKKPSDELIVIEGTI